MAGKIFRVHLNSYHRQKEKRDRHKIIVGWMIYQATLGQNTKQYLQLIQTTWFCKFLSKLKSRFLQALKGNSFLNYWVIFSTPIELYNQTWSKHCTRKHNRKWIQQNHDFMDPQLQKLKWWMYELDFSWILAEKKKFIVVLYSWSFQIIVSNWKKN